jgi:hypothetical protein
LRTAVRPTYLVCVQSTWVMRFRQAVGSTRCLSHRAAGRAHAAPGARGLGAKLPGCVAVLAIAVSLGLTPGLRAGYVEDWARMKSIVPRGYVCFRSTNSISIDGKLAEPTWQAAPWTQDFVEIGGEGKPAPRHRTRAKMLWDSTNLYVAAELEAPHIWATLKRSDADLAQENAWAIYLDPDGDNHDYLVLTFNALNVARVELRDKPPKDGGTARACELAGLRYRVQVRGTVSDPRDLDTSWTIEVALPWAALEEHAGRRVPPSDGNQWRLNFCRVEWPTDKAGGRYRKPAGASATLWAWSAQGVEDVHRPEKWGFVQFSRKRGTRARFIPDPALAARSALQEVYYHQKDFQRENQRWASSLAELRLVFPPIPGLDSTPVIQLSADGYEASLDGPAQGLKPLRWHIRQDALFWADPDLRTLLDLYYQRVISESAQEP